MTTPFACIAVQLLSLVDLRVARHRFHLQGLVQVHHVIPRQFRNHPSLDGFDVDAMENLVLMPNREAAARLHLREDRLIHDGGHAAYNRYVGRYLETLRYVAPEVRQQRVHDTLHVLRGEMRRRTFVPWE